MFIVWWLAALAIGLGLGLCLGMLIRGTIANWESAETTNKIVMGGLLLAFGGGAVGATVLFGYLVERDNAAFYLLGSGVGLLLGLAGFFYPSPPYTMDRVKNVVQMSDALRDNVPDIDQRALLITTGFVSPKVIAREAKVTETELAEKLEVAADAAASGEPREGSQ